MRVLAGAAGPLLHRYLVPGERVLAHARPHAAVLTGPVAAAALGTGLAAFVGLLVSPNTGSDGVDVALGLVALALTLRCIRRIVRWRSQAVAVTTARVLQIDGLLSRRVIGTPLDQIQEIALVRSAFARLTGSGHVELRLAGPRGGVRRLESLAGPERFLRILAAAHTAAPAFALPLSAPPDTTPLGRPPVAPAGPAGFGDHDETIPLPPVTA